MIKKYLRIFLQEDLKAHVYVKDEFDGEFDRH